MEFSLDDEYFSRDRAYTWPKPQVEANVWYVMPMPEAQQIEQPAPIPMAPVQYEVPVHIAPVQQQEQLQLQQQERWQQQEQLQHQQREQFQQQQQQNQLQLQHYQQQEQFQQQQQRKQLQHQHYQQQEQFHQQQQHEQMQHQQQEQLQHQQQEQFQQQQQEQFQQQQQDQFQQQGQLQQHQQQMQQHQQQMQQQQLQKQQQKKDVIPARRALSGRRNILGAYSYADLIAMAITSSPTQELSLSQIYEWMIDNIEFFRNDAGNWRNSVRHNLSLHQKFVRVPARGHARGSTWTVDPNAGRTKFGRRRCFSMGTSKMALLREKKTEKLEAPANNVVPENNDVPAANIRLPPAAAHRLRNQETRLRTMSGGSTSSMLPTIPSQECLVDFPPPPNYQRPRQQYQPYQPYQQGPSAGIEVGRYAYEHSSANRVRTCSSGSTSTGSTISPRMQEVGQMDISPFFQQALNLQTLELPSADDIDNIHIDSPRTPLECDVEAVINNELAIEGVLDFD